MTKGKHARSAALRDQRRAVDAVAVELAALAAEKERLADAQLRLRDLDAQGAELRKLETRLGRITAKQTAELETEIVRLERDGAAVERASGRVDRAWERHLARFAVYLGATGRVGGLELLLGLLHARSAHVIVDAAHETRLGSPGIAAVRQARGERPADFDDKVSEWRARGHDADDERPPSRDRSPHYGGLTQRPIVAENYKAANSVVHPDDYRTAEHLATEGDQLNPLSTHTTAAFRFFAAMDWITEDLAEVPERPAPVELGGVRSAGDVAAWTADTTPWPDTAPTAEDCWRRDGAIAKESRRLTNLWSPAPRFARPGDASVLRYLYVQRMTGLRVARTEIPIPAAAKLDNEATWGDPTRAPLTASLREKLARAVPFWFPPGETAAFADSEPLDDDSIADIALPYADIMIVPAEPLVLEPVGEDESVAADLDRLDRYLARTKHDDYRVPSECRWQVDAGDALQVRGGLVEAILVRADRDGRLADGFAWCIAVPHPNPRVGVLGRVVVPAFLSRTVHADMVRQLAAAVAWADWRTPTDTPPTAATTTTTTSVAAALRNGTTGDVHVLDATRTNSRSGTTTGDGPQLRPHLRRGHWKRVRIGTRADWDEHRSYRRVRIPAVVVNAGVGVPFAAQVYRLRPRIGSTAGEAAS